MSLILVIGLFDGRAVEARQRGELVPGSRYVSARGMALGDAFLPLVDDGAGGLFYNPAAIARLKHVQFEPLNMGLETNSDFVEMFNRNAYKVTSLSSFEPELGSKSGKMAALSGSIFPNFFMRGLAFGLLVQNRFSASETDGVINYRSLYQFIPSIGGGLRLASGVVRVGYSLQWVQQTYGDVSVPRGTDPLGYNQMLAEGSGLSHNFGLAVTLPVQYLPSFNLVVRNIFGLTYRDFALFPVAKNSVGVPEDEPMTVDVSASIQPKLGAGALMNFVLQYRDVTHTSSMSFFGRLAAGAEFSFRDQFFLRTGWGSGYINAGLGLRRKLAELSLSWYAEEHGNSYHEKQDRKYMLQYQFRAF